ncbi:MAG TPA: hypothetical protein VJ692_07650 [Nitrospiraceae bacterium]|nr:hypothetical protein [Nitrospiraceae bacterium]
MPHEYERHGIRKTVLRGIVAMIGLALISGHASGQEHPDTSLELVLETGKTQVVLGEPVYVTVRLRNTGTAPVDAPKVLDPQTGVVQIEVASASRPRLVFLPLFYADAIDTRKRLRPGEEVAAVFPIFYGGRGWTFPLPGAYRIMAVYRGPVHEDTEPVRSNAAAIEVMEGHGAGAFLMRDSLAGDEAGKFLLWQRGDHLRAGIAHLLTLIETFPDSPVSDYALLALGRNLSRGFRNYSLGRVRQPDCAAALDYLEKVRTERLPPYLQIQNHLDQARCLMRVGQPVQARALVDRTEQGASDRAEFGLLFQQAFRLEPALKAAP